MGVLASPGIERRRFLLGMGALVVVVPAASAAAWAQGMTVPADKPPLTPTELDTWIAVARDGEVTVFFGKPDVGQGVDVAVAQMVAEEMDVPLDKVTILGGDTALTYDQGGVSGSTGVQRGGTMLRDAAAEARRVLVEAAAVKLKAPVETLKVRDGVVSVIGSPRRKVSYAQLVDGGYFRSKLAWNGQTGNGLVASGEAKPKTPDQYRLVGTSAPRRDVAGKVFGTYEYVFDLKVPGMMYGRVINPTVAGAVPVAVDEASIAAIKGARVVRRGDFIAVVAEHEWDAIKASRELDVTWSDAKPAFFDSKDLYDHIARTPAIKGEVVRKVGDVDAGIAGAAKVVEAHYEWPFQSHSSLSPACAVADVRKDGVTLWVSTQKPHAVTKSVAELLGRPVESVRAISLGGPGSYGRNDAGDAAGDAALMSAIVGRPVRAQGDRASGHAWDPKGAASIHKVRGGLDAQGRLVAYDYMSKGFARFEVSTAEVEASDLLAGQRTGFDKQIAYSFGQPEDRYEIANRRLAWETIPTLLAKANPLRTSHLRDPLGPQLHFASESFIDECALAAGADPAAFRISHLKDPREIAVIKAAVEKAGWKPGPPGARAGKRGTILTGQGLAYTIRAGTFVAVVAEVEIDPATGRLWPRRFTVSHDCGLIINPDGLRLTIEGNVVHGASRALFEETTFDAKGVTSVDWATYPILDMADAPEAIDVVLINRPDIEPSGAGEPATRPIAAALANAIFDASGRRPRRAPFTPERIKALLA